MERPSHFSAISSHPHIPRSDLHVLSAAISPVYCLLVLRFHLTYQMANTNDENEAVPQKEAVASEEATAAHEKTPDS
jgi:hypothetical protein